MVKVQGLTKRLGKCVLFRKLDFVWDNPEIICITGANGAGKTSLLSLLAGVIQPDAGEIFILGEDLLDKSHDLMQQIAYVPDNCPVYSFISGGEWLSFVKSLRAFDPELEEELLAGFGLVPYLNCQFGEMSLGTSRKFLLTSALMCHTSLVILDEPSNGLDNTSFDFLCLHLEQRKSESLIVLSCLDVHQQIQLGARTIELCSLERS
ncbi:ABC transporter ATP-binding protein [Methylomonas sp. AM2-LC]|uniref:ABC transporter ATP-binding protein n=1 Tax=Methylomonas sp. AM2-LC TaxID=3153301 RepID=UPI003265F2EE